MALTTFDIYILVHVVLIDTVFYKDDVIEVLIFFLFLDITHAYICVYICVCVCVCMCVNIYSFFSDRAFVFQSGLESSSPASARILSVYHYIWFQFVLFSW